MTAQRLTAQRLTAQRLTAQRLGEWLSANSARRKK